MYSGHGDWIAQYCDMNWCLITVEKFQICTFMNLEFCVLTDFDPFQIFRDSITCVPGKTFVSTRLY